MLANLLLAVAFQVGPFYEQRPQDDFYAVRPFYATEGEVTDIVWPFWTSHEDWWRAALFLHSQESDGDYQLDVMPFWFNGYNREGEKYWGAFPFYGNHPHIMLMYDLKFVCWPIYMTYRQPVRDLTSHVWLFPFFHYRSDGSWGLWPLYAIGYQRESTHQAALWPIFTWASYEEDRDTAGAGYSWMFFPVAGGVSREREDQWMFIPPLFNYTQTREMKRYRLPWPIVEWELGAKRDRWSFWPIYEQIHNKRYFDGEIESKEYRLGWKLIEKTDDEFRVFPFWVSTRGEYYRAWPFWDAERQWDGSYHNRFLSLIPIRNIPQIDRNWSKFWTFYENDDSPTHTDHSLLWGIIQWRTHKK